MDSVTETKSSNASFERVRDLTPDQSIEIRGRHADGQVYRWWPATVESADAGEICVIWPAGTGFESPTPSGRKLIRRDCRAIFWPERMYFITETYGSDGEAETIFADIAALHGVSPDAIEYTDYELDVVKNPGFPVEIEDEDEFLEAAIVYGYTEGFQAQCRAALAEAVRVVETWKPRGAARSWAAAAEGKT
jgi:predicted RNA-binding protein associated with RNAse of E/G family